MVPGKNVSSQQTPMCFLPPSPSPMWFRSMPLRQQQKRHVLSSPLMRLYATPGKDIGHQKVLSCTINGQGDGL